MTGTALGLVLLSACLHASWNTLTKGSGQPTAYLLAMELAIALLLLPVLLAFEWGEVPARVWWGLAASILVHALYANWLVQSYEHGDLSLVYPIARSTPALVPLLAVPLLGESIGLAGGTGIALVLVGMWAVQTQGRIAWRAMRSLGALFAYLTLLASAFYSLIDKQVMIWWDAAPWTGPAPRALVFLVVLELGYLPFFAALAMRRVGLGEVRGVLGRSPGRVFGGALAGIASYGLILEAFRSAPVSYVVAVRQTSVLFAVGLAVLLLGERPGRVRVLGAVAIVAGVALIALAPHGP